VSPFCAHANTEYRLGGSPRRRGIGCACHGIDSAIVESEQARATKEDTCPYPFASQGCVRPSVCWP
jgi:hypothetical protein